MFTGTDRQASAPPLEREVWIEEIQTLCLPSSCKRMFTLWCDLIYWQYSLNVLDLLFHLFPFKSGNFSGFVYRCLCVTIMNRLHLWLTFSAILTRDKPKLGTFLGLRVTCTNLITDVRCSVWATEVWLWASPEAGFHNEVDFWNFKFRQERLTFTIKCSPHGLIFTIRGAS